MDEGVGSLTCKTDTSTRRSSAASRFVQGTWLLSWRFRTELLAFYESGFADTRKAVKSCTSLPLDHGGAARDVVVGRPCRCTIVGG